MNSTQLFGAILLCAAMLFMFGGAVSGMLGIASSKWVGASQGFFLYGFFLFFVAIIAIGWGTARRRHNSDKD